MVGTTVGTFVGVHTGGLESTSSEKELRELLKLVFVSVKLAGL